jgi:hypothetical protein
MELLESDPPRACETLESLPLPQALEALRGARKSEPDQVEVLATWASGLADLKKRQQFVRLILLGATRPKDVSLLEYAEQALDRLGLDNDARVWVATRLALDFTFELVDDITKGDDLAKQFAWIEKNVPADRFAFAKGALGHLYQPRQALLFLNTELDKAHDDQLIAGYVESEDMRWHQGTLRIAGGRHGDTAFRLATRVRDPELRASLLTRAWTDLLKDSPEGANEILSIGELTAADRAALAPAIAARSRNTR